MPSFLLPLLFLLLACNPKEQVSFDFPPALSPTPPPEVREEPEVPAVMAEGEVRAAGRYVEDYFGGENGAEALAEEVIGNGQLSLLFFFAVWCPRCQEKEATFRKLYGEGVYSILTYKLNYDESMALKARYGVTTQDTVVLLDGTGMATQMVVGANETDLQYLLSRQ